MSAWPPLAPLAPGEFAPAFVAPTRGNAAFHFTTLPGRYVLLGFLPPDAAAREMALAAFARIRSRFDDDDMTCFLVIPRPDGPDIPPDQLPGQRWFFDADGAIGQLFGDAARWLLLDPMLRVLDQAPLDAPQDLFARIADLPPAALQAGRPLTAPVLIVPRVFDRALCQRLIALYEAEGGQESGVMRDVAGKTVGVLDPMKRRRDVIVHDEALRKVLMGRLETVLIPMIRRAFMFRATRLERYLVACYDAQTGGWFRPHRDNETFATAHRRFAVSINLNAEAFDGGDLRFPEFGPRTYRPPTGGAAVFCCSLQHEATPVTHGRRYAFLPFLYDEDGARIRAANQDLLTPGLSDLGG